MQQIRVQILKNNRVLAEKCVVAVSFFGRLKGLLGQKGLEEGAGMLLPGVNSIHMWFMRFSIDVVFLKRSGTEGDSSRRFTVVSLHRSLKPWRLLPVNEWSAEATLELSEGQINRTELQEGDELCIS